MLMILVHSPTKTHLKLAQEFFPLDVVACVIPFMQFAKRGLN
jgi:hypothetical protein